MKIFLGGSLQSKKDREDLNKLYLVLNSFGKYRIYCPLKSNQKNKKEHAKWVFDKLNESNKGIFLLKKLTFGTCCEIGYCIKRKIPVIILTSWRYKNKIKEHIILIDQKTKVVHWKQSKKELKELIERD